MSNISENGKNFSDINQKSIIRNILRITIETYLKAFYRHKSKLGTSACNHEKLENVVVNMNPDSSSVGSAMNEFTETESIDNDAQFVKQLIEFYQQFYSETQTISEDKELPDIIDLARESTVKKQADKIAKVLDLYSSAEQLNKEVTLLNAHSVYELIETIINNDRLIKLALGLDSIDSDILSNVDSLVDSKRSEYYMATSLPVFHTAAALINYACWWEDDERRNPGTVMSCSYGKVELSVSAPDADLIKLSQDLFESQWDVVKNFNMYTCYMHVIFSIHAARLKKPWEENFIIKGSDIIKLLGLDKRTDLTRETKLELIVKHAKLVGLIDAWITWKQGPVDIPGQFNKIWDVSVYWQQSPDLLKNCINREDVFISVRAGQWSKYFLNMEACKNKEAFNQVGPINLRLLQLNPYRKPLTSRLAIYLSYRSRVNKTYNYSRDGLLAAAGKKEELEHVKYDRHLRNSLKKQWKAALKDLRALGWKVIYNKEKEMYRIQPPWVVSDDCDS